MPYDGRLLAGVTVLAAVVEAGTLSRAGGALGLSASGVSRAISRLEARVGVRLLERTTRSLRLTDEGRLYLSCCRQALKALDDAEAALHAGQNVVRGKVRISATSDFGRNLLMHWLDEFNEQYPEVTFALQVAPQLSPLPPITPLAGAVAVTVVVPTLLKVAETF